MKMNLKRAVALVAGAVVLAACGGGDSKSKEPVTTSLTTKVTGPQTTAEQTTAEQTTTTAPDYTYELVLGDVVYDESGDHLTDIPDDGSFPWDAQNPEHPDGLNLRSFSELPSGTAICFRGWGELGDASAATDGRVAIYQHMIGDMTEPQIYLAIHETTQGGMWQPATDSGIVNYPDGTWSATAYVTLGSC